MGGKDSVRRVAANRVYTKQAFKMGRHFSLRTTQTANNSENMN
jgi:hypothetical protein